MNTPLKAVVAALTLLSGGRAWAVPPDPASPTDAAAPAATNNYNQGTTADGKTIVAPGTYGPFQGPTCVAGSSGCSAASAAAVGDAAAVNSLLDIGKQQETEAKKAQTAAVQKDEDAMVKSGVYSSIERTADGKGAVITLPNGMIAYSNYEKGYDSMPKSPEDLLKDPNAPAAVKAAAQKIVDAKNPEKMQMMAADSAMFTGNNPGGSKPLAAKKAPTDPTPGLTAAGDTSGDRPGTGGSDTAPADPKQMGAWMADNGGLPGGSSDGSSGGTTGSNGGAGGRGTGGRAAPASEQAQVAAATEKSMESVNAGHLDTSGVDVIVLKNNLERSAAVKALESSAAAAKDAATSSDDGFGNGKVSQGSKVLR